MTGETMTTTSIEHVPFWGRGKHGVFLADVPLRPGGGLPSFIIIGAAKAGTTSLHHYLAQHPALWMCPYKEPHFFSCDAIYERGLDWYKGLFADAKQGELVGEASTSYSRWPQTRQTPRLIHEHVPGAKLIYLVREPVARTQADCLQALKYARYVLGDHSLDKSIDALIEQQPVLVQTSEYIEQIEAYLRYFDRSQLLVLFQDELQQDPRAILRRIFEFLEVDPDVAIDTSERHNSTEQFIVGLKYERIAEISHKLPAFAQLRRFVPQSIKNLVKGLVARGVDESWGIEPMSDEKRGRLVEHFRPFNRRLEQYMGRPLPPSWW
jgi:hypothetical protein